MGFLFKGITDVTVNRAVSLIKKEYVLTKELEGEFRSIVANHVGRFGILRDVEGLRRELVEFKERCVKK